MVCAENCNHAGDRTKHICEAIPRSPPQEQLATLFDGNVWSRRFIVLHELALEC